jgi:glycosyltransferase involved in cell wall biosynthesis
MNLPLKKAEESRRRPKTLILTQYYSPEPNFITQDVAHALADASEVTVITTHPNFPGGKFYDGYAFWRPVRTREGRVTVWRLPHLPDRSTSKLRRALSYLSFAIVASLFAPFVAGKPRLVWVYHTPFTTALAALFFKYAYGSKLAFTTVDLWPENFVAVGLTKPGRLTDWLFRYRRFINRQADVHLCCSRSAVQRYIADGLPRERTHFVPVWVEGIPSELPATVQRPRRRNIVYAGTLGPSQPIETIVRGAAQLLHEEPDVTFDIFGTGVNEPDLRALAVALAATNVRFHGRVSPSQAFDRSASAFAQIITLRPTPLFEMVIPSKLYLGLAAGSPILAGLRGEAAEMIATSGAGVLFDAESIDSFCSAVRGLLRKADVEREAMGQQMRGYFRANFRREKTLARYQALLLTMTDAPDYRTDSIGVNAGSTS